MGFTQKTDKLEQLWESKLQEASEKQALVKVMNALGSSKTEGQLDTAVKMATNFQKMYSKSFWEDFKEFWKKGDWKVDVNQSLINIIQKKEKELGI